MKRWACLDSRNHSNPPPCVGADWYKCAAIYKTCARASRHDRHSGRVVTTQAKGNHMARSTRNDAQRQSAPNIEPGLPDHGLIGESGAALESLNLGHASLRNECWSGASGRGLDSSRSEFAAPQFATQRLRGPRRRRTQLHHSRPQHRAEARFTPDNREILTF